MQDKEFFNELEVFKEKIDDILLNKENASKKQKEKFLKEMEKCRYNLFNVVDLKNDYEQDKIDFVNNHYKAELKKDILKITIPEVIPKFKNINNYAYKNIMLNVAKSVQKYSGLFNDRLTLVLIIIHENQDNLDIDNKFIKPIVDALVLKNIIQDDNINNMFYMALGRKDTKKPCTEVYVMDGNYMIEWINKIQKL